MRAIVTISEINETKMTFVQSLCKYGAEVCVVEDEKFKLINGQNEAWTLLKQSVTVVAASYDTVRLRYGTKIHAFNGRWSNNPAKIVALENVSEHGTSWVFEDDVYCKMWRVFFSSYEEDSSDFLCTITPTSKYPWFVNGWLIGDRRHTSAGVAGLYAFRISQEAARAVLRRIETEPHLSHHEVFIPWSINDARLSVTALLDDHSNNMHHNHDARGGRGRSVNECDRCTGLIFHPVKSNVSRAFKELAKMN